jgi:quercetin dioxygenase-like cupin family protein
MNVKDLHQNTKAISTASLFKTTESNVTSIQILANQQLKEHITKVPALLLCLTGESIFENENGIKLTLTKGDYVNIEPNTKHWINANSTSNFILIK